MNPSTSTRPLFDTVEAIGDAIKEGTQIGMDLFETLSRSQTATATEQLVKFVAPHLRLKNTCDCTIPPPCWMPRALGEVVSHVCPGGTASLRIRVTNCSVTSSNVSIKAQGNPEDTKEITVVPATMQLGPMERGSFVVSMPVSPTANFGEEHELLLWVVGCMDHYLRWTVRVAKRGGDCCFHEVDVDDCPDYVHHWYDHFYCQRPCRHRG